MVTGWDSRKQQICVCILKDTILGNEKLSAALESRLLRTGSALLDHKASASVWGENCFGSVAVGSAYGKAMMEIHGMARKQWKSGRRSVLGRIMCAKRQQPRPAKKR